MIRCKQANELEHLQLTFDELLATPLNPGVFNVPLMALLTVPPSIESATPYP